MMDNANRRWSKVHSSVRGFFSFWAWKGGRKNNKAPAPTEHGHNSNTLASSIALPENGAVPSVSNGDEPVAIEVPKLSLDEIITKTDNFSSMSSIGQGSHARIYYMVIEKNRQIAVKKLDKPLKHVSNNELLTRISIASRLKHENFVELLGYYVEEDLLLLAYEFAAMGSLHDILHGMELVLQVVSSFRPSDVLSSLCSGVTGIKGVVGAQRGPALPWSRRVRIALDAAKGLDYLHQNNIIHRNIRSSNVLLFHGFGAKIADYNLFNQAPDMATRHPSTRILGSFVYHPPEYVMFSIMTRKSDVYSFGVVLLELLTGRKPVDDQMPSGHQSLVYWATPKLTPEKVQQIVDPRLNREDPVKGFAKLATIAAACLQFEPDSRPEMSAVVGTLQTVAKYEP